MSYKRQNKIPYTKWCNLFRVNLSHGTRSEKSKCFDLISSCKLAFGDKTDNSSRSCRAKIRVNRLEKSIKIRKGQQVYISSEKNGQNVIPISKEVKFQIVEKGAKILIDDGKDFIRS